MHYDSSAIPLPEVIAPVNVAILVVERYVPRIVEDVPCTAPVVTVKVTLLEATGTVAVNGT
jgi:hypothetical protein